MNLLLFALGLTLSVAIMATDLYVPSLPAMVLEFATTESHVQKTISYSFLGVCLSSLVAGPLADRFTKARIFQGAMILFGVTGVLSPLCQTIEMLWIVRFFQGISVGALPVIIMSLIADLYQGKKLTQIITMMGVVITISLAFSPVLGGWIGEMWGWKGCFWVTTGISFVLTLLLWNSFPKPHTDFVPLSIAGLKDQIVQLISHKNFKIMCLCHGLIFAANLAFRSTLSHYFSDVLHMGPLEFGTFLSMATVATAVTGLSMGTLLNYFSSQKLMEVGMGIYALTCLVLLIICAFAPLHVYGMFSVMILSNVAVALCFSTTLSLSLTHLNASKGFASSVIISFRSFLAGLNIYLCGVLYNGNLWSLALPFICGIGLFLSVYFYYKPTLIINSENI
jgi:DHA1 family bicyclomycin/chloramphenicol resistance-like MFS transporter